MTLDIGTRAAHFPNRTAVIDHPTATRWTYRQLATESDAMARRLADRGLGQGDVCAVFARNQPAYLGLFFGARSIGATIAPISHRLPRENIAALLERIDPSLVVVDTDLDGDILNEADVASLLPDGAVDTESFEALESGSTPEFQNGGEPNSRGSPLYLHTGGTTGTPKVVVIGDGQIEWNAITEVAAWGLGKDTVAPILLPMYHTGGWNLLTLPTLYVGGTVVLQREFDPAEALEMIERYGATHVFGVAAIFDAMAASEGFAATDFDTVEWFMSGGGPTSTDLMETYQERGVSFVLGYGLTEGGPNNLYVDPDRERDKPESVGKPFPDVEARVVSAGDPAGTGTVGELEFRGPVTAERYLETTDGTFAGEWVSTGDLARRDDDGDYYIVGRTDNMFVSGGENVYPEAIESVLEGHPAVDGVGVVGVPDDRWGTVPKAILEGDLELAKIQEFAETRLADHEVPKTYEVVDELPRSGPGKIDRAALEGRFGE